MALYSLLVSDEKRLTKAPREGEATQPEAGVRPRPQHLSLLLC